MASNWYRSNNQAPFLVSDEMDLRLKRLRDSRETHVRATFRRTCVVCHVGLMVQDGEVATGLPLPHYTPDFGEVLSNHYMECEACGFEQAS